MRGPLAGLAALAFAVSGFQGVARAEDAPAPLVLDPGSVDEVPRSIDVQRDYDVDFVKLTKAEWYPSCGYFTTSTPIASFELKEAMPKTFTVAVAGAREGMAIWRTDDGVWWSTCNRDQAASMSAPKEGWAPGHYVIYPTAQYASHGPEPMTVEFYDPAKPMKLSDQIKKLTLDKKLAKPLFVELTTQAHRRKLRPTHAGQDCAVPLPATPDLVVDVARPLPGLVIRPLFAASPVTLRVQTPTTETHKSFKFCPSWHREYMADGYAPSYETPTELHLGDDQDGQYLLSFGTPNPDEEEKILVMIFDASTKFDPAGTVLPVGEVPVKDRWVERVFPQLDVRELGKNTYPGAKAVADLFAHAPAELFVYPKLDLDKDLAQLRSNLVEEQYPKKNEPLLVLNANSEQANVVTADGLVFTVRTSQLVARADPAPAWPEAPRPMKKDLRFEDVVNLAPPAADKLVEDQGKKVERFEACAAKAWAPFANKVEGASWRVRSNETGEEVEVESPKAKRIRAAGQAAIDRKCGSEAAHERALEANRKKLVQLIDKERIALLAQARAGR